MAATRDNHNIEMAEMDRTSPPPRDPNIAVAEEYEAALKKGTIEALELFIARHPEHPLAEKARAELKRLSR